jgi:hypothetical protein
MDHRDVWLYAAKNGLIYDICFLHLSDFPGYTSDVIDHAAMRGYVDIVYFLSINRKERCSNQAFYWASAYGQAEVIKTLYLFFPQNCDVSECIKIAKINNKPDALNVLTEIFLQQRTKCYDCYKKISSNNSSSIKNTCKKCFNIKFPHMVQVLNCDKCNVKVTNENSSRVKKRCKPCYNFIRRTNKQKYINNLQNINVC